VNENTEARALDRLVSIMRSRDESRHSAPHVAAYGWLSRAVKQFLDGDATADELAADLSTCETALLQVGGH
jgi:hypothetical protein